MAYTNDALRHKIQGAVVLEAVVTVDDARRKSVSSAR
jgi:hypothetical protein